MTKKAINGLARAATCPLNMVEEMLFCERSSIAWPGKISFRQLARCFGINIALFRAETEFLMNRERNMILMLLDLCAFAYSQDQGRSTRQALDGACALAERYCLPEAEIYRNLLRRFELDTPGHERCEMESGIAQLQDGAFL